MSMYHVLSITDDKMILLLPRSKERNTTDQRPRVCFVLLIYFKDMNEKTNTHYIILNLFCIGIFHRWLSAVTLKMSCIAELYVWKKSLIVIDLIVFNCLIWLMIDTWFLATLTNFVNCQSKTPLPVANTSAVSTAHTRTPPASALIWLGRRPHLFHHLSTIYYIPIIIIPGSEEKS